MNRLFKSIAASVLTLSLLATTALTAFAAVQQSKLYTIKAASHPANESRSVAPDSNNVGVYAFYAYGLNQDIEVQELSFYYRSNGADLNEISDIKLVNENGQTVAGPVELNGNPRITFTDDFVVPMKKLQTYTLTVDINGPNEFETGERFSIYHTGLKAEGLEDGNSTKWYQRGGSRYPQGGLISPAAVVQSSTLEVSKASTPVDQVASAGTANFVAAAFDFETSGEETVLVEEITLKYNGINTNDEIDFVALVANDIILDTSFVNDDRSVTFNNIDFEIQDAEKIEVMVDISHGGVDAGENFYLTVEDVEATGLASQNPIEVTGLPVDGPTVKLANSPEVEVTVPEEKQINFILGSSVILAEVEITNTGAEDVVFDYIGIEGPGSAMVDSIIIRDENQNFLGAAAFDGNDFELYNLDFEVEKQDTESIFVEVQFISDQPSGFFQEFFVNDMVFIGQATAQTITLGGDTGPDINLGSVVYGPQVEISTTNQTSQAIAGSNLVGRIDFANTGGEDVVLDNLHINIESGEDNFVNAVQLKDGSGEVLGTALVANGKATFFGLDLEIERDTTQSITVYTDLLPAEGGSVAVFNVAEVEIVGQTSGQDISISDIVDTIAIIGTLMF